MHHNEHLHGVTSSDTHINHVNLHRDTIYTLFTLFTITLTIPKVFLDRTECRRICRRKGEQKVNSGLGIERDWIEGGGGCSVDLLFI